MIARLLVSIFLLSNSVTNAFAPAVESQSRFRFPSASSSWSKLQAANDAKDIKCTNISNLFPPSRLPLRLSSPLLKSSTQLNEASAASSAEIKTVYKENTKKRRFTTAMAFLIGWSDLTLSLRYKTFATMMTGNTMWMAVAFADRRFTDVGYYASVIASYLVGLTLFRRVDISMREKTLPIFAAIVTALFVGSDVVYALSASRWIPVMMLATGFGIVNSIGSEVCGTMTFVLTGHMTKMTHVFMDRVSKTAGRKKLSKADWTTIMQNAAVCGGFFGGVLLASVLQMKGMLCRVGVFSTIGILYGLLFSWKDMKMESMGGAWWLRKGDKFCELDDDGELCE